MYKRVTDYMVLWDINKKWDFTKNSEEFPFYVKLVWATPDTSSVDMVELKKQLWEEIKQTLPASVSEDVVNAKITEAINNLKKTLPQTTAPSETPTVNKEEIKREILASLNVEQIVTEKFNSSKATLKNEIKEELRDTVVPPRDNTDLKNEIKEELKRELPTTTLSEEDKENIKNSINEELSASFNTALWNADYEQKERIVYQTLPDHLMWSSTESTTTGGRYFIDADGYRMKDVSKVSLNISTPGKIHFAVVEDNWNVIRWTEREFDAEVWYREFPVNYTMVGWYLAVNKPGVSTAKFKFGNTADAKWFYVWNINSKNLSSLNMWVFLKEWIGQSRWVEDLIQKTWTEWESTVRVKEALYEANASNLTGGWFCDNNTHYVNKRIKRVWFHVDTVWVMKIARYTFENWRWTISEEQSIEFTKTGIQWFDVNFEKPFSYNDYIVVAKRTETTGKFRYWSYGGVWFYTIGLDMTLNPVNYFNEGGKNATANLNIWYEVVEYKEQGYNLDFKPLEWKFISVTWDSISTYQGSITAWNSVYYDSGKFNTYGVLTPRDTWWGKFAELTWARILTNDAWSGSRVTWTGPSALANSRIRKIDRASDVLLVMIWTNDLGNNVELGTFNPDVVDQVDTIANAYTKMVHDFTKYLPKTRLVFLAPLRRFPNNTTNIYKNTNGVTVAQLNKLIKEICDHFGVECIDTGELGWTQYNFKTYLPDGLHPNVNGMNEIAKLLVRKLF